MIFKHSMRTRILLCVLLLGVVSAGVNKDMPRVQIKHQKNSISTLSAAVNKKFSLNFPDIDYEIHGSILTANPNDVQNDDLYNYGKYTTADSCQLIPTDFQAQDLSIKDFDFTGQAAFVSLSKKKIYVTGDQKIIHTYVYDQSSITQSDNIDFQNTSAVNIQIGKMVEINDHVYIVDNSSKLFRMPNSPQQTIAAIQNFAELLGQNAEVYRVQNLQSGSNQFFAVADTGLFIMKLNGDKAQIVQTTKPPQNQLFYDAVYDDDYKTFYILQSDSIVIKKGDKKTKFQLESSCMSLTRIKSTLFANCQVDKNPYTAEFLIDNMESNPVLILNRYYDLVEGARDVFPVGFDKQMFISDDQIAIMSLSVPRQVILEMERRQPIQSYLVQPVIHIQRIPQFDSKLTSASLMFTVNKVTLLQFVQIPPRVECTFNQSIAQNVVITAAFNTSHCTGDRNPNSANLKSICTHWYPFLIKLNVMEYDSKVALLIVLTVVLIAITLALLCIGCGFQRIQSLRVSMFDLTKKIKRMKDRKKSSKPI